MKRFLALILCFAVGLCPMVSFAASADTKEPLTLSPSRYEQSLLQRARATLGYKDITDVFQSAVLFSSHAVRESAVGTLLPAPSECTLSFGDRALVREDSVLKIYTTVVRTTVSTDEGGQVVEETKSEQFETKTLYLSAGTSFAFLSAEEGVRVHVRRGSVSCTYTTDRFLSGECTLSSAHASVDAGENYLLFGADENATLLYRLGGKSAVKLTTSRTSRTVKGTLGLVAAADGRVQTAAFPLALSYENCDYTVQARSVLNSVLQNSALADGAVRALKAENSALDINTMREGWLSAIAAEEREFSRTSSSVCPDPTVFSVTPEDLTALTLCAALEREKTDGERIFVYPASSAAYTVRDAGKRVNLAELSEEDSLELAVTMTLPLSGKGDGLYLSFDSARFDINLSEDLSTYVFRLPVSRLNEAYASDGGEKTPAVVYHTDKTHLFFKEASAGYELLEPAVLEDVKAGEPVTLKIKLLTPLSQGDEFYLIHTPEGAESETLLPTAVAGENSTYLFTVTPKEGAGTLSLVTSALYRVTLDCGLENAYSAELSIPSGTLLAPSLACPVLKVLPADESDFVPVVLQKMGGEEIALTPDAFGRYVLAPLEADTTLSPALGYPVVYPAENELYRVEPLAGFAPGYAPRDGQYRFKVHLSKEATLGTSILVKNNGVTLTPDSDGVFTIAEVTQPVRLTVTYGVTYNVFLPTGDTFTVSPYGGDGTTVMENGTFRFTLQLNQNAGDAQHIVAVNESVITPDASGVYTVSGINRDVYVTVRPLTSLRVILPQGDGFVAAPCQDSKETVSAGGSFSFTVTADEGVSEESEFYVYANDVLLEKNEEGVYVLADIQNDVYVTVRVKRAFAVEIPAENEDYEVVPSAVSVLYGEKFTFTVTPKKNSDLTVFVNGRPVKGVAGVYTVEKVYSDLYISVSVGGEQAAAGSVRVLLFSTDGISAQALTSVNVSRGESFSFSVTLPGEDAQEGAISVRYSSGVLSAPKRAVKNGKTVFTYTLSDISDDCQITVQKA